MILPIVGYWHRPPAAAIVQGLRQGTPLTLVPEPTNQFDPNAIAVMVEMSVIEIPESQMPCVLKGLEKAGMTPKEFSKLFEFQLGYIPAATAATLRFTQPVTGRFLVTSNGKPAVEIEAGEF